MTNYKLIMEGPDKSGKTTLIEALAKEYKVPILKVKNPPKTKEDREKIKEEYIQLASQIKETLEDRYPLILLDRFFYSEKVYCFKRDYSVERDLFFIWFERFLKAFNYVFILCDPGEIELLRRFRREKDEYIQEEKNLLKIRKRYLNEFYESPLKKIKLDTNQPVEKLIKQIFYELEHY